MKLRDLLKQWADKNTGWVLVIGWLLGCLTFYSVISIGTQLMIVFRASIGMIFITALCTIIALSVVFGRDLKKWRMKLWQWLLLAPVASSLITAAAYATGWIGLFIMTGPVSTFVCCLIGGTIITAAVFINTIARKK